MSVWYRCKAIRKTQWLFNWSGLYILRSVICTEDIPVFRGSITRQLLQRRRPGNGLRLSETPRYSGSSTSNAATHSYSSLQHYHMVLVLRFFGFPVIFQIPLSHGAKRQSCNAIETALAGIAIRCLLSLLYREKRETVWSGTGTTVYAWKPRASGKPEPTLSTWLAGNRGTREPRLTKKNSRKLNGSISACARAASPAAGRAEIGEKSCQVETLTEAAGETG